MTNDLAFVTLLIAGLTWCLVYAASARVLAAMWVLYVLAALTVVTADSSYFTAHRWYGLAISFVATAGFLGAFGMMAGSLGATAAARDFDPEVATGRSVWLRVFLLVIAGVATFLTFRSGVPLFGGSGIDAARTASREARRDGGLLLGVASLAAPLGAWISWSQLLYNPRRYRFGVWGVVFSLVAFLGASRNSLLLSLVIPFGAHAMTVCIRRSRPIRFWRTLPLVAIGVMSLTLFVGVRTTGGSGPLGDEFRIAEAGPLDRGLTVTALNLGSPFETLGRLANGYNEVDTSARWGSVALTGIGLEPLAADPVSYSSLTEAASHPHHMTVAGISGRLLVDFGIAGTWLLAPVLGGCLGLLLRRFVRSFTRTSMMQAALVVYVAAFAQYDFLPLAGPATLLLLLGLGAIRFSRARSDQPAPVCAGASL